MCWIESILYLKSTSNLHPPMTKINGKLIKWEEIITHLDQTLHHIWNIGQKWVKAHTRKHTQGEGSPIKRSLSWQLMSGLNNKENWGFWASLISCPWRTNKKSKLKAYSLHCTGNQFIFHEVCIALENCKTGCSNKYGLWLNLLIKLCQKYIRKGNYNIIDD